MTGLITEHSGAGDAASLALLWAMTEHRWWHAHAPYLEKVKDPPSPPGLSPPPARSTRRRPGPAFEFGLARVVDGVEVLIRRR